MELEGISAGHRPRLARVSGRDFGEMPYAGARGPADPGPPLIGVTRNGWHYELDIDFTIRERWWIVEALEACAFDPERLYATGAPLETANAGVYGRPNMRFYKFAGPFPHAADHDYALVNLVASNPPTLGWEVELWDGLAAAEPPYGGERFFKETVLHAIGHQVGRTIAYADMWKMQIVGAALGYEFANVADAWFNFFDAGDGSWASDPEERFAEAFKDIYGARWARAFLNRTGAPMDYAVLAEECSTFWPLRAVVFRDAASNSQYGYNARTWPDGAWTTLEFHYHGSVPQAEFMRHSHLAVRGVEAVAAADLDREIYYMNGAAKVSIEPLAEIFDPAHLFDAEFDIDIDPTNTAGHATTLMFDYGHNPNVGFGPGRHVAGLVTPIFDDYGTGFGTPLMAGIDYPAMWDLARWTAPSEGFVVDPPKTSVPRLAGYSRGQR